ncbi:MAG TPA: hypothetical protein VFD10_07970, partial [Atribacterota bacterium]|nr:hypothetical protein [Atribacterota bacterium]
GQAQGLPLHIIHYYFLPEIRDLLVDRRDACPPVLGKSFWAYSNTLLLHAIRYPLFPEILDTFSLS